MNKEQMYDSIAEKVSLIINVESINACLFTHADVSFHTVVVVRYIRLY